MVWDSGGGEAGKNPPIGGARKKKDVSFMQPYSDLTEDCRCRDSLMTPDEAFTCKKRDRSSKD